MINKVLQSKLLFILLLVLAFVVRMYHFGYPISDWHSWRQADTSSVSRNFIKYGFDVLHPKFDDLSKGVSLIDNPKGYRFVEFPFYNILQAGSYKLFDRFTLEEWGRLVTIASSLGSIIFLYLLVGKYISIRAGFFSAFLFAFAPYSIYYGRTLLPDQFMLACMLGGLYFFDRWTDKKNFQFSIFNFQFLFATLFTAAAILMKPFVLFFFLAFLYLAWRAFGRRLLIKKELWIFLIFSMLPFIAWRLWMLQYPEGIPQSNWLFNGSNIRFKGAFFRWIFAERITHFILGYFGLPFVIIGIITQVKKEGLLFLTLLVSSLIYLTVMATGNVQHDYYQILILPVLAIFFGKGVDMALRAKEVFNKYASYPTVVVSLLLMLALSWYTIRDFYNLQHTEILEAGMAVDRLTPKDAKVIAPLGGDTTFLYSTNRQGWPVVDRSFIDFIKAGAGYMVFVNPTSEELNFVKYFAVTEKGKNYIIFNLKKPLPASYEILDPKLQK